MGNVQQVQIGDSGTPGCTCHWVDIGVGMERVTDEYECPVHNFHYGSECPVYWCPSASTHESPCHGGFNICCSRPELHQVLTPEELERLYASPGTTPAEGRAGDADRPDGADRIQDPPTG